jgi:hypothetical protein
MLLVSILPCESNDTTRMHDDGVHWRNDGRDKGDGYLEHPGTTRYPGYPVPGYPGMHTAVKDGRIPVRIPMRILM